MSKSDPGVLIVDDEQNILDALEDILEDDFQVYATSNPVEGLEILSRHKIGVVLSDQRMPGMAGHEFLSKVAGESLATRVLLTGYTDLDALVNAVNRSQIFAFIAKPWEPNHLRSLVVTAMEHYRLVEELHSEKFLMESMMNTVKEPIVFVGPNGAIVRANQSALGLLGLSSQTEILESSAETIAYTNPTLTPILTRGNDQERVISKVLTTSGQHRWFSTTQVPFGSNQGFISVAHDITELHETETALAKQAERLEYSLRELQQFAHVTAHHLQEPLRDVVSHLQILRSRSQFGPRETESFDYAIRGATRMKALFSDFVRYIDFDQERMKREEVDLQIILQQIVHEFSKERPGVAELICVEGEFPVLQGDMIYLKYLFRELIENSNKYKGERELELSIRGGKSEDTWLLSVSDRGMGVDAQHEERIFELFQRLHPADEFNGTGLGLAICRKVVTTHGGKIWAQSNAPERGLTIWMTFPVIRD